MIDKPVTFKLLDDKDHCMILQASDEMGNPHKEFVHPGIAVANESGYYPLRKIAFSRDIARKFVDQYNRDVLGLTPAQAEGIEASSMFPGSKYPANVATLSRFATRWKSEEKEIAS